MQGDFIDRQLKKVPDVQDTAKDTYPKISAVTVLVIAGVKKYLEEIYLCPSAKDFN